VVAYVKTATAQGKSQQQIGKELIARGVTPEQVERLKSRYEESQGSETNVAAQSVGAARVALGRSAANEITPGTLDDVQREVEEGDNDKVEARRVYGHSVFRNQSLSFEPNENVATPQNYRLGPGDEIVIDIWGASEDHIRQTITPEGSIMVSQIGPIYLNGMTIQEANNHIKGRFASKYAGVGGSEPESEVNVTLGQVRTIQVDLMGEVAVPGTYRLSPFSTVFHALYKSGGINDIGSMRNIEVLRNGKRIVGVDVYEFLFDGKQTGNIRLQEGDVIIVPPYENLVNISGNVKRPMYYEVKDGETLGDLIEYAGGFTGDAYTEQVRLARQSGRENELFNIVNGDFDTYKLLDGDIVTVGTILDRYANRVELKGSVFRPGMYALATDLRTVGDLVKKAEGLTEDAYTTRVMLYREGADLSLELIPVDLGGILSGRRPDITLKRNDVLVVPSIHELNDRGELSIFGLVAHPGVYPFADNTTVEDLVIQAGGLLNGASTAKVDVSRRLVDPTSLMPTDEISKTYTFSLKDGLVIDGDPGFMLEPYDIVEVRRSPGYQTQRRINVVGEVAFDGGYTLETKNERVSDIIRRAGGLTPSAYIKGAHVMRQMSPEEVRLREETLRLATGMQTEGDSISIAKINLPTTYSVAIELDKALAMPGSDADLVMKEGDVLSIPEYTNTVRISGDVMFPNTVTYKPGKKLKYYVEQAGGYGEYAKKNKAFIIYMNGEVAIAKGSARIEPGCQIVVPSKHKGQGVNWTAILSSVSALGSVATMAAALANLFK
ncbi:MAG: SLBB domain-containing protein, partial [Muribaculum sp.]|nr:SLBB domain-containing protein [Muribaculum sp.]